MALKNKHEYCRNHNTCKIEEFKMKYDPVFGWITDEDKNELPKGMYPGEAICPVVREFPFEPAKCECGSEVVYGKGTNLHTDYCPKYKK